MARHEELSDEELLVAARAEPEALGAFYRRHVDTVIAYFGQRTSNPEVAADLMAETFAAVLVGLTGYQPTDVPARAWLYVIAHNKLVDSYRRGRVEAQARKRLELEPLVLDDDDIARVIELTDLARAGDPALSLLAGMPEEQRSAIEARVFDERAYTDIATELECSEAVVRKRVSRGLARLRPRLEEPS